MSVPIQETPRKDDTTEQCSVPKTSTSNALEDADSSLATSLLIEPETSLLSDALGNLDSLLATPVNNADIIVSIVSVTNIANDPLYLYDAINASRFAAVWDGLLVGGGILSLCLGVFTATYRRLRIREQTSHLFFLIKYSESLTEEEKNKFLSLLNIDKKRLEHYTAAVYFYSPDTAKWLCWIRRFLCRGKIKQEFKDFQNFLNEKKAKDKKTEQEILAEIFQEIIDKLILVLNEKNPYGLTLKRKEKEHNQLEFTEESWKKIFPDNDLSKINLLPTPSFGSKIYDAIGSASFIYWLVGFVFYFIPVGIVAGLSFPPLLIAFAFLAWQIGYALGENINRTEDNNSQKEKLLTPPLIEVCKRQTFLADCAASINFNNAQLKKDLEKILSKRRFAKIHAALDGFISGCFYVFFTAWLLGDLFKLLAGLAIGGSITAPAAPAFFGSILIGIAAVTLILGISYGIYCAIQSVKNQQSQYNALERKIQFLEKENSKVPNISLQELDRLLRGRKKSYWTTIKKALNRAFEIIKRLGTGSLVFRLVIAGSLVALTPLVISSPVFIACVVVFAVLAAAWSLYAYQMNSEVKQAENVLQHFHHHHLLSLKMNESKTLSAQKEETLYKKLAITAHESKIPSPQKEKTLSCAQRRWGKEYQPKAEILSLLFAKEEKPSTTSTSPEPVRTARLN